MAELQHDLEIDFFGNGSGMYNKLKDEIKLPSARKRRVSLSDIIAATIGEEARSGDILYSDQEITFPAGPVSSDIYTDKKSSKLNRIPTDQDPFWNISTENSNNACDVTDNVIPSQKNTAAGQQIPGDFSVGVKNLTDTLEHPDITDLPKNIGFDTEMDFLTSLFGGAERNTEKQASDSAVRVSEKNTINKEESAETANTSFDSDLEDSMHFVDPDEKNSHQESVINVEPMEPVTKKQRVSLYDSSSCPFPVTSESFSDGYQDFLGLFNTDDFQFQQKTTSKSVFRVHGITRARSFSGNIKPKLSRQSGKGNLLNKNSERLPNFGRTRSFSEAYNPHDLPSLDESELSTSLTSLFDSQDGSLHTDNPFFNDLKSLLITDCKSMDCPKTLFETLSTNQKQDVYARERNLQAKFSSLQAKYPDEVRELSSFYRQQSAEVETERLKEIHDDNVPVSYRNHLNSFYDNQLHMIMERVEKSLSLLAIAKREFITINRPFKSRPLLSRKAVKMMEEWYSRNFEHPYPGSTAVEALAKAGEITPEQVKKWFANKRNRCKNTRPVPEIANMKRKRQFSARW